jgi:tellurite methyltransferase
MTEKPFWEESYSNDKVSTFAKRPSIDVLEFFKDVEPGKTVIDVGCGEGRNSIYLAELGHYVDAFDISDYKKSF